MKQVFTILTGVLGIVAVVALTVVRIALAAALSLIAPLVLPLLVLLSGGGLVIAGVLACTAHWHQALMAGWACLICTILLTVFAGLIQLVNSYAFNLPVRVTNAHDA